MRASFYCAVSGDSIRSLGPQIIITSKPRSGRKRIRASDAHRTFQYEAPPGSTAGTRPRRVVHEPMRRLGHVAQAWRREEGLCKPVSTFSRRVLAGDGEKFAWSGRDSGISPLSPSASKRFAALAGQWVAKWPKRCAVKGADDAIAISARC